MKRLALIPLTYLFIQISFAQKTLPEMTELNNHELSWINPDLINQEEFTEVEIENQIKRLVEEQTNDNLLVVEMEIPFNEKKLNYLGFIHPNNLDVFTKNQITAFTACELNRKLHIYKYGDFFISTEEDKEVNQENVYYALRAISILKYRYTEAYQRLFVDTRSPAKPKPTSGLKYLNINRAVWIGFNYNPVSIAANRMYLILDGYADSNNSIDLYRNTSNVYIHSENILGNSNIGSKPIYGETSSHLNRIKYLKEGLLESIVHEMLHNYIEYSHSALPAYNAIYKMRGMKSFNFLEENIVLNTSLSYFYKKSGFTDDVKDFYYSTIFHPNINSLQKQNLFATYYESVFNMEPDDIRTEMKMNILD